MASRDTRFRRLGGKSRRYLDTETGREVSRRKRDEILEQAGKRAKRDIVAAAKARAASKNFARLAREYAEENDVSLRDVRNSPDFREAVADLQSTDWKRKRDALKKMGRRDNVPDFVKPGETDLYKQSGTSNARAYNKWKKQNGGLGRRK